MERKIVSYEFPLEKEMPPCCRGMVMITLHADGTWVRRTALHTIDCATKKEGNDTKKKLDHIAMYEMWAREHDELVRARDEIKRMTVLMQEYAMFTTSDHVVAELHSQWKRERRTK